MPPLSISSPVGDFVTHNQYCTSILNKHGIDFCCGGHIPLNTVCKRQNIDVANVFSELQGIATNKAVNHINWQDESLETLIHHILDTHHVYVKQELPRLSELVNKVASVYPLKEPWVTDLRLIWQELHDELTAHLQKEEQVLFPRVLEMCAAEKGADLPPFHCGSVQAPIQVMEIEHDHAGDALRKLRKITNNYTAPDNVCTTFKVMLQGLEEFEADLHQHVHKENNIMFAKALELENSLIHKL